MGCPFCLQGIFLTQGSNPVYCTAGRFFTTEPPGRAIYTLRCIFQKENNTKRQWSLTANLVSLGKAFFSLSLSPCWTQGRAHRRLSQKAFPPTWPPWTRGHQAVGLPCRPTMGQRGPQPPRKAQGRQSEREDWWKHRMETVYSS